MSAVYGTEPLCVLHVVCVVCHMCPACPQCLVCQVSCIACRVVSSHLLGVLPFCLVLPCPLYLMSHLTSCLVVCHGPEAAGMTHGTLPGLVYWYLLSCSFYASAHLFALLTSLFLVVRGLLLQLLLTASTHSFYSLLACLLSSLSLLLLSLCF